MKPQLKRLSDQVIVITGASSGIGLTTAEMAAERGAAVVLAARSEAELNAAAARIRERGGRAAAVVADVTDPAQVEQIARRALIEFGRIDTWVNNAGVSVYGTLEDVPMADKRRLFDTTFWGVVHGSETAVPHLRQHGGVLINVGSVLSDMVAPLQGIYTAAKHAVKGYTDALRMELEIAGAPILVTLIKPGPIDTPYTQHARNYMAREPNHPSPAYPPEEVAHAILRSAERPVREIVVGGVPRMQIAMQTLAPRLSELFAERAMVSGQQSDQPPYSKDSLYAPSGEDYGQRRSNGKAPSVMRSSMYTRAVLSDAMRAAPLVLAGAAVAAVVVSRR
jgi:NAD(P)-dependent dehydrogenase (short-subunit alcohol dehydrogenase family)